MTYYGRWTYKFEMAQKMGAAGALIVHETGRPATRSRSSRRKTTEQCDLWRRTSNMSRLPLEGWITLEQAKELCAMAGQDYETLKAQGAHPRVQTRVARREGVDDPAATRCDGRVAQRGGESRGRDPTLNDEWVIYTAHWDHFGVGQPENGDRIYHGAIDNAVSGRSSRSAARSGDADSPKRSILLLAPTAEEAYVMGSSYYALHPLYPLSKTLGVVNMDILNVRCVTKDVIITGFGQSDLDDYAREAAATQGRVVKPDPIPESGFFYRSDHFPFARGRARVLGLGRRRIHRPSPGPREPGAGRVRRDPLPQARGHRRTALGPLGCAAGPAVLLDDGLPRRPGRPPSAVEGGEGVSPVGTRTA